MDAFLHAGEHVVKAGGRSKMMNPMQDDQPEYWDPAEEDDIEESFYYYADQGLPIPPALWERRTEIDAARRQEWQEWQEWQEAAEEDDIETPGHWDTVIQDLREDYCIIVGRPIPSALWEMLRVHGWSGLEQARRKDKEDSEAVARSFFCYVAEWLEDLTLDELEERAGTKDAQEVYQAGIESLAARARRQEAWKSGKKLKSVPLLSGQRIIELGLLLRRHGRGKQLPIREELQGRRPRELTSP